MGLLAIWRERKSKREMIPGDCDCGEDSSNSLHLGWSQRVLLPNLKAFVPSPPFGRPLLLERHSFLLLSLVYAYRARDRDSRM